MGLNLDVDCSTNFNLHRLKTSFFHWIKRPSFTTISYPPYEWLMPESFKPCVYQMNYTRILDPVQESDCFVRMRNSDDSQESLSIRLESPFDLLIFHRKPHVCSCCDSRSVCVVDFPCKLHGGWCKRAAECLT